MIQAPLIFIQIKPCEEHFKTHPNIEEPIHLMYFLIVKTNLTKFKGSDPSPLGFIWFIILILFVHYIQVGKQFVQKEL
jgi:hypothetical protein